MTLCIGVLKETRPDETRVALVPEVASRFADEGAEIVVQSGAGVAAGLTDAAYGRARIVQDAAAVLAGADLLLAVQPPAPETVERLRSGSVVISFMQPHRQLPLVRALAARGLTSFAMELIPRISRAQSMDALSSQAAAAGYKAVLLAADNLVKFFPMLTTAAGTIRPAQVLVIGAGVAGLQAIATARRLGAVVHAYDVRSATREQVESLGARFVDTGVAAEGAGGYARELTEDEKRRQADVLAQHVGKADAVVTTASVPGRPAPRIIPAAAVENMAPGSVIVDLAAESGGNCELTQPGRTVEHRGVRIFGPTNLAAGLPRHASEMYARNLYNFVKPALKDGALAIDWQDEVYAASVLTHAGEVRHAPTRQALEAAP
jgi:H+-translocating NAD(P) transhydrogenase subunit alpha